MLNFKFTYKNSRASTIVILVCILLFSSLWYLNIEKILNVFSLHYPIVYIVALFGGIILIINYSFVMIDRFFVHKGSLAISENDITFNLRFSKKLIKVDDLYDVDYIEIVPKKAVDNIGYRLIVEYRVNRKGKTKKLFLDTPGKIENKKDSEFYEIYSILINK